MKTRLIAFVIVILAAGTWRISELRACTSFAVYVDSNRVFYGMNFDYPEVEMKLSITEAGDVKFFHLQFYSGGNFASTVGMNQNGFFSSCQMLYPEVNEWHYPGLNEITIGTLYYYSLMYCDITQSVNDYLLAPPAELIHNYGLTLHDIFADKYGNAIVVEVGDPSHLITEIKDNFLVMANFPNNEFEGMPYTEVTGVGADRYKSAFAYITDNIEDFDLDDGIETLKRAVQSSGGYPTQCSLLFDPLNLKIYVIIKRDFDHIWKVDLSGNYIETYYGFDSYKKFDIVTEGILISELENYVASLENDLFQSGSGIIISYPSPFSTYTDIEFYIGEPDLVSLEIFNSCGQKIKTLISDIFPEGKYNTRWYPENLESGVYYSRLTIGRTTEAIELLFFNNH
jgi:hypothetical protein